MQNVESKYRKSSIKELIFHFYFTRAERHDSDRR